MARSPFEVDCVAELGVERRLQGGKRFAEVPNLRLGGADALVNLRGLGLESEHHLRLLELHEAAVADDGTRVFGARVRRVAANQEVHQLVLVDKLQLERDVVDLLLVCLEPGQLVVETVVVRHQCAELIDLLLVLEGDLVCVLRALR